jgi:hypothetical protein
MKIIDAMTQDLQDKGLIISLNYWQRNDHERTYLRARGYRHDFGGCRSHQLYWDHNTRQLVNQSGKGTTPHEYDNSVNEIVQAFESTV